MAKKNYHYSNVSRGLTGGMICAHCNKSIEDGDYRYYENPKAYITHHKSCCLGDPAWEEMDLDRAEKQRKWDGFVVDIKALMQKHGRGTASDLIMDIESIFDIDYCKY
ncbi:MAG: hypothetical protein COB36_12280 [Alphaproteobacteria bacterium]|nr:MAG: hypothetical protein COB36_12280 [Alphaproteobacteria bacterium]